MWIILKRIMFYLKMNLQLFLREKIRSERFRRRSSCKGKICFLFQIEDTGREQSKMFEKDKEILMQSVINDEDFQFYKKFHYFKLQFENANHFKLILEENFYDYELLKAALVRKHENIINYLINDCGCRVSNPNKINLEETPLHLSMNLENLSIFETILKKNASIYEKNLNGITPLHAAFNKKHYKAVAILLNYISSCNLSFNPDNKDDILHFHIACITKHMSSIRLYLSFGFNVNSHISVDLIKCRGLTPLLFLLSQSYYSTVVEFVRVFINGGADVNCSIPFLYKNIAGFTPLHFAVINLSVELVELLLKNGADPNRSNVRGKTPLHYACKNAQHNESNKIIEILLNNSASPVATDKLKNTPIHLAFLRALDNPKEELINILDKLISKQPLKDNLTDRDGLSFFHILCSRNEPDRVNDFLNAGALIDSRILVTGRFQGFTALHFAVYFDQKAVVEVLLKRDASVNSKTYLDLHTPLHLACEFSRLKFYEVYRECENAVSSKQPIMADWIGNRTSQLDIIKLLLLHGADVEAKCRNFLLTPLLLLWKVDRNASLWYPEFFKNILIDEINTRLIDITNILLSHKADINCKVANQESILHIISVNDLPKVTDKLIECLVTAGADINAVDKDALTPLHYAANGSKEELLKIFLKYKANVNAKCKGIKTPLRYAISLHKTYSTNNKNNDLLKSTQSCIIALLQNGSDINLRTENGRSSMCDALSCSNTFVIEKLLYYGADINAKDSSGNSIMCSLLYRTVAENGMNSVLYVIFTHVQKLLDHGLYVNGEVLKFCTSLQEYYKTELPNTNFPRIKDNAFDECINELNSLKIRKIE